MDERLIGHAADEGVDHVGIGYVGELIALLGEGQNVLPKGLIIPLPIVAEVLEVPLVDVGTLEVVDEDRT